LRLRRAGGTNCDPRSSTVMSDPNPPAARDRIYWLLTGRGRLTPPRWCMCGSSTP
jgi:hypothetical protein